MVKKYSYSVKIEYTGSYREFLKDEGLEDYVLYSNEFDDLSLMYFELGRDGFLRDSVDMRSLYPVVYAFVKNQHDYQIIFEGDDIIDRDHIGKVFFTVHKSLNNS